MAGTVMLIAAITEWSTLTGIGLTLIALLTGVAAGFAFDEAAVRVTSVTARGTRWAPLARLVVAVAVAIGGAGLVALAADEAVSDRSDWAVLALALGGGAALVAMAFGRRQVPRPGSGIAAAVVLLGLMPLVLSMLLELRSPYPVEAWTADLRTTWWSAGLLAWGGALMLALRGVPRRHVQP
ncbi:hypothetical protein ncot_12065 [Nocardioides sp. JQ2195]|uniref:hypothetical protein n=1 Tax=Nocardioides sp. JQ2195 TaxID=2592334 RepID=UPI00143EA178|nr:hypothetical protein [Nocardioides sp. JQ2195]QIX27250.1 hypothetical protein ncot_12065 [Nocardioides sp. JQ2195]